MNTVLNAQSELFAGVVVFTAQLILRLEAAFAYAHEAYTIATLSSLFAGVQATDCEASSRTVSVTPPAHFRGLPASFIALNTQPTLFA